MEVILEAGAMLCEYTGVCSLHSESESFGLDVCKHRYCFVRHVMTYKHHVCCYHQ